MELQNQIDLAEEDESISAEDLLALKWRLCDAFREEEIFWHLKSREIWFKEGDKNTKYFHAITKQKRARNKIIGLLNQDGLWVDKEGVLKILLLSTLEFVYHLRPTRFPFRPSGCASHDLGNNESETH